MRHPRALSAALALLLAATCGWAEQRAVTDLAATYRGGQVFITWDEPEGVADVRFRVLMSREPITDNNADNARVAGDYLMPGSATDWWLNPETYGRPLDEYPEDKRPEVRHEGWLIEEGGERLNPDSGLFVHTVTPETAGSWYYALTVQAQAAEEEVVGERAVAPVLCALAEPVHQEVAAIEPIYQGDPAGKPARNSGAGLPLDLALHAKRGRGGMEWLVFGDATLGWRDGLPFKFGARVVGETVRVSPTDRTWIGRMFPEGNDGCQRLTPAIHSFWYGYNDHIYDPELMAEGLCVNFTERRVMWIVRWVQGYFGTDPNRSYAAGGSMGAIGSFNIALRHPEIFAAIAPHVGIVTYKRGEGGDSVRRVEAYTGPLDAPCNEGMTVGERLDSTRFVLGSEDDLPFVVMSNGRNDGSIPWWVNPDFYRAMQQQRQGFIAAWNDGEHGTTAKLLPEDIVERRRWGWLHRFALNESYPAFSNCSADQDPGNGEKTDGDPVGYMNRGLDWEDPVDEPDRYEIVIKWYLEPEDLPVTVDVTPRRRQQFKPQAGAACTAINTDLATGREVQRERVQVGEHGLLTFPRFQVTSAQGNRLTFTGG